MSESVTKKSPGFQTELVLIYHHPLSLVVCALSLRMIVNLLCLLCDSNTKHYEEPRDFYNLHRIKSCHLKALQLHVLHIVSVRRITDLVLDDLFSTLTLSFKVP